MHILLHFVELSMHEIIYCRTKKFMQIVVILESPLESRV